MMNEDLPLWDDTMRAIYDGWRESHNRAVMAMSKSKSLLRSFVGADLQRMFEAHPEVTEIEWKQLCTGDHAPTCFEARDVCVLIPGITPSRRHPAAAYIHRLSGVSGNGMAELFGVNVAVSVSRDGKVHRRSLRYEVEEPLVDLW